MGYDAMSQGTCCNGMLWSLGGVPACLRTLLCLGAPMTSGCARLADHVPERARQDWEFEGRCPGLATLVCGYWASLAGEAQHFLATFPAPHDPLTDNMIDQSVNTSGSSCQ